MKLKLSEFPEAIATVQRRMQQISADLASIQDDKQLWLADCDRQIAEDATLTNDSRRKAARFSLQAASSQYQEMEQTIRSFQSSSTELSIQLEFLRNSFRVAQIEAITAIAFRPESPGMVPANIGLDVLGDAQELQGHLK
jgi:hypothetical protein